MVDFTGDLTAEKCEIINHDMPNEFVSKLMIFRSGKSYHGYVPVLYTYPQWLYIMGSLLLLNYPNKQPVTDHRWIGHRLRGGFSALRWSCNGANYSSLPIYAGTLTEFYSTIYSRILKLKKSIKLINES